MDDRTQMENCAAVRSQARNKICIKQVRGKRANTEQKLGRRWEVRIKTR